MNVKEPLWGMLHKCHIQSVYWSSELRSNDKLGVVYHCIRFAEPVHEAKEPFKSSLLSFAVLFAALHILYPTPLWSTVVLF